MLELESNFRVVIELWWIFEELACSVLLDDSSEILEDACTWDEDRIWLDDFPSDDDTFSEVVSGLDDDSALEDDNISEDVGGLDDESFSEDDAFSEVVNGLDDDLASEENSCLDDDTSGTEEVGVIGTTSVIGQYVV